MKRNTLMIGLIVLVLGLAAAVPLWAFNLDAAKAVKEPCLTIVQANTAVDKEKLKCPAEFAENRAALALFHLCRSEKGPKGVIQDDTTLVEGYVCRESISRFPAVAGAWERAVRFAWHLGIVALGFWMFYVAWGIRRLTRRRPEYTPQSQQHRTGEWK